MIFYKKQEVATRFHSGDVSCVSPPPVCAVLSPKFSPNSFTVQFNLSFIYWKICRFGGWVWQPTVTLPWISGRYLSSQASTFGPCRCACIWFVVKLKLERKLHANVAGSFYWSLCLSRTKIKLKLTFVLCIAWHFPGKSISLDNASHKTTCAEWRGFHRKKCSGVTSGSPLPCHYEFPSIMSPFYVAVQWKIPEHKEQMPLFVLDCGANGDCWVYSESMLFLLDFWSIWGLYKSTIIHF